MPLLRFSVVLWFPFTGGALSHLSAVYAVFDRWKTRPAAKNSLISDNCATQDRRLHALVGRSSIFSALVTVSVVQVGPVDVLVFRRVVPVRVRVDAVDRHTGVLMIVVTVVVPVAVIVQYSIVAMSVAVLLAEQERQ